MAKVGTLCARFGMIRDSQWRDRRTLRRCALHRKKLGPNALNFKEPPRDRRNIWKNYAPK
jgi:hypothetical protein